MLSELSQHLCYLRKGCAAAGQAQGQQLRELLRVAGAELRGGGARHRHEEGTRLQQDLHLTSLGSSHQRQTARNCDDVTIASTEGSSMAISTVLGHLGVRKCMSTLQHQPQSAASFGVAAPRRSVTLSLTVAPAGSHVCQPARRSKRAAQSHWPACSI
jgi:hypothetical protein